MVNILIENEISVLKNTYYNSKKRKIDIYKASASRALFHTVDRDRDPVGDLLIQRVKGFLPDDLRRDLPFRLVCYSVGIIKHGTIGKIPENRRNNILRILAS